MSEENRSTLTFILWLFSAIVLGTLFISAAAQNELTPGHIFLATLILATAVIGTPYIWRLKDSEEAEKAKRRRLDNLLRDLSDEELVELKNRLSDREYPIEMIADSLGDDGELMRRK